MKQDLGVCTYLLTLIRQEKDSKSLEFSNRPILGWEKKVSTFLKYINKTIFTAPSNKMSTSGT